jgi:enoyl-CoA hydratase/carnithine racemase
MHEINSSVSDKKLVCRPPWSDLTTRKGGAAKARNMPDPLLIESRGPVVVVTLNRPEKLNAISTELISGLMSTLHRIELDGSARAIVITGAGRADSALVKEATLLAQELAEKPPLTLAAALSADHRGMDASIDEGLATEEAAFAHRPDAGCQRGHLCLS